MLEIHYIFSVCSRLLFSPAHGSGEDGPLKKTNKQKIGPASEKLRFVRSLQQFITKPCRFCSRDFVFVILINQISDFYATVL